MDTQTFLICLAELSRDSPILTGTLRPKCGISLTTSRWQKEHVSWCSRESVYSKLDSYIWETPDQSQGFRSSSPETPRKKNRKIPHRSPTPNSSKNNQKILKSAGKDSKNCIFGRFSVFFEFFLRSLGLGSCEEFSGFFFEEFRGSKIWIPVTGRAFLNPTCKKIIITHAHIHTATTVCDPGNNTGDRYFPKNVLPAHLRKLVRDLFLAHQNRTIAIASDLRVDGAKLPEIPQKEGVWGLEIAARNRRSLAIFHRTLKSQRSIALSCLQNRNDFLGLRWASQSQIAKFAAISVR